MKAPTAKESRPPVARSMSTASCVKSKIQHNSSARRSSSSARNGAYVTYILSDASTTTIEKVTWSTGLFGKKSMVTPVDSRRRAASHVSQR